MNSGCLKIERATPASRIRGILHTGDRDSDGHLPRDALGGALRCRSEAQRAAPRARGSGRAARPPVGAENDAVTYQTPTKAPTKSENVNDSW